MKIVLILVILHLVIGGQEYRHISSNSNSSSNSSSSNNSSSSCCCCSSSRNSSNGNSCSSSRIPKVIFQTSITRQPEYVIKMIIDNIPSDWTYIHYTDDEITDFFNNNYIEEFSNIIDKFHNMPIGIYHFRSLSSISLSISL